MASSDLLASILGGGGAPAPAGGPGLVNQALAGPVGPPDDQAAPADNVSLLEQGIDLIKQYVDGEDDEIHTQTALQCIAKLQSILADEQKMSDGMLQGKIEPRALRKASASGGY